MNKLLPKFCAQPPAKLLAVFIVVFTIGIASLFLYDRQRNLTNLYVMEKQLSVTRNDLLGYSGDDMQTFVSLYLGRGHLWQ